MQWRKAIVPGLIGGNVLLLGAVLLYFGISWSAGGKIRPVVGVKESRSKKRIAELERRQSREVTTERALQLSRLYKAAGEPKLSYEALLKTEQHLSQSSSDDTLAFVRLALAYLEMGFNDDARRLLKQVGRRCEKKGCAGHVKARLTIVAELARRLAEAGVDATTQQDQVDKIWRQVVKPVKAADVTGRLGQQSEGQMAASTDGGITE